MNRGPGGTTAVRVPVKVSLKEGWGICVCVTRCHVWAVRVPVKISLKVHNHAELVYDKSLEAVKWCALAPVLSRVYD